MYACICITLKSHPPKLMPTCFTTTPPPHTQNVTFLLQVFIFFNPREQSCSSHMQVMTAITKVAVFNCTKCSLRDTRGKNCGVVKNKWRKNRVGVGVIVREWEEDLSERRLTVGSQEKTPERIKVWYFFFHVLFLQWHAIPWKLSLHYMAGWTLNQSCNVEVGQDLQCTCPFDWLRNVQWSMNKCVHPHAQSHKPKQNTQRGNNGFAARTLMNTCPLILL